MEEIAPSEQLERARLLIEEIGYETDEVPEQLPFPALLVRVPLRLEGSAELVNAELVVADAGDRLHLVLPNIDRLAPGRSAGDTTTCRRILESSFGFAWARASLDEHDGELRIDASIPIVALSAPLLAEVIDELSELLIAYWVERIPVLSPATAGLPN